MRFFRDHAVEPKEATRRRRSIALLAALLFLLTPIALFAPDFVLPGETHARLATAIAFRPLQLLGARGGVVRAATRADDAADPRDVKLVTRLQAALDLEARTGFDPTELQLLTVLRAEGGVARRPTILVLDTDLTREEALALAGRPVVHGEDLIGFVAESNVPRGADGLDTTRAFDGRLRVHSIDHVPSRRAERAGMTKRRLTAIARSTRDPAAEALRMLVEPGHPKDPYRLRVLRSAPRQLETWRSEVAPYVARTAQSDRLHPGLPEGLVLGVVEDLGYRERAFVLQRFVEPRFDTRSLVRVGILLGDRNARARTAAPPMRRPVRCAWQSPQPFGWRRVLLRGAGVEGGAAVVEGLRCLGQVEWASSGTGSARPLCARETSLPLVLMRADDTTRALVVTGRGIVRDFAGMQLGRFLVEHPRRFAAESWRDAWVFTGVAGPGFPHGLLCGRVRRAQDRVLDVQLFGLSPWPRDLELVGGEIESQPDRPR